MNGETNLDTKTLPTPKLKKLQSPKSRLKQALLGSITTLNFTQFHANLLDGYGEMESKMFPHTFVLVAVTSFTHCHLPALITPPSLEGAMELKFHRQVLLLRFLLQVHKISSFDTCRYARGH